MNKYCKFFKEVKFKEEKVWEKEKEYKITYENEENYYFGSPISNGISKTYENTLFEIKEREEIEN